MKETLSNLLVTHLLCFLHCTASVIIIRSFLPWPVWTASVRSTSSPSICLSTYLSVCLPIYLPLDPFGCFLEHLSFRMLSICLRVCLPECICVYPSLLPLFITSFAFSYLFLYILFTFEGVVTKPFGFEGRRRMQQALQAIENLRAVVDTLIIVSNDRQVTPLPFISSDLMLSDLIWSDVIDIKMEIRRIPWQCLTVFSRNSMEAKIEYLFHQKWNLAKLTATKRCTLRTSVKIEQRVYLLLLLMRAFKCHPFCFIVIRRNCPVCVCDWHYVCRFFILPRYNFNKAAQISCPL